MGEGGGHSKKSLFQRLWRENGHNSINSRASALKLHSFDREQNFGYNQAEARPRGQNSRLFSFLWLKRVKFLSFDI